MAKAHTGAADVGQNGSAQDDLVQYTDHREREVARAALVALTWSHNVEAISAQRTNGRAKPLRTTLGRVGAQ